MEFSFPRALARTRLSVATQKKGDSMKKAIVVLILVAAAGLTFAQTAAPAPRNQIDLGVGYYGTDLTSANNWEPASYGQSDKYSPSANWNGKYTYTLPVNSDNTLKFSLGDDGWYGFYTGNIASKGTEAQNTGLITPLVEYLGYGADVTLSAPLYYYNPADLSGYNEMKYAYKESGYLPVGPSTTSKNYPLDGSDSFIPTINLKAFYKYSFDKTTWVSAGAGVLYAVAPTPWLTDLLPKVSGAAYGIQLDVQYDYYNAYNDNNAYYDTYLEPKLTYDLVFLKLVPGLKIYTQARISMTTTNPKYNTTALPNQPFHDTYIQPGLNYSISVPKVGSFALDAGWRFTKIDMVGSAGTGAITGIASNPNDTSVPFSDLRLAFSYSYKF